jgi:hypothetical protein
MAHLGKSSIFWYRTYKMNGHIWRCRQSTFKRYIEKIHCTIHSWGSTWTLKRILGSHSFPPDAQWRIEQIDHHPPEIIQIFLLYIEHSSIIMESLVSLILTYSKYYILYIYIYYIHIYIFPCHMIIICDRRFAPGNLVYIRENSKDYLLDMFIYTKSKDEDKELHMLRYTS